MHFADKSQAKLKEWLFYSFLLLLYFMNSLGCNRFSSVSNFQACKKGHEEVVEVLLKYGVDTKAQSSYEQTAIQIALRNQHFEIQNLLQEHEKRSALFHLNGISR